MLANDKIIVDDKNIRNETLTTSFANQKKNISNYFLLASDRSIVDDKNIPKKHQGAPQMRCRIYQRYNGSNETYQEIINIVYGQFDL